MTSFPTGGVPAGFISPGFNSIASVEVRNNATGATISNATVSLNGISLAYVASDQEYEAEIVVNPAQAVVLSVSVSVGGAIYTVSGTQSASYPTITAPVAGDTWSSSTSNSIAWLHITPTARSFQAFGVMDPNGDVIWPSDGFFEVETMAVTSVTILANSLTSGSRLAVVGILDFVDIPGAASGSTLEMSGFNYVPITVTAGATLVSIAVAPASPTLAVANSLQLAATGTYSDSSTLDLTSQVAWTSSDPAKATVDAAGIVTGVASGTSTITATLGAVPGSTIVTVF